jgi:hypothetical protein
MINKRPNGNGVFTHDAWGHRNGSTRQSRQQPVAVAPHAAAFRDRPRVLNREMEEPIPDQKSRMEWQMIALWIFVAASFAALAFTGYLVWAKCHGVSPP